MQHYFPQKQIGQYSHPLEVIGQYHSPLEMTYNERTNKGDLITSLYLLFMRLSHSLRGPRMGALKKMFTFLFYFEPRNNIYPKEFQFNEPDEDSKNLLSEMYLILLHKALLKFDFIGHYLMTAAYDMEKLTGIVGSTDACMEALWEWAFPLLNVIVQYQLDPEDTRTPYQVQHGGFGPGVVTPGPIFLYWNETEIYRLYAACTPDLKWLSNGTKMEAIPDLEELSLRGKKYLPNGEVVTAFDVSETTDRSLIFFREEVDVGIKYSVRPNIERFYTPSMINEIWREREDIRNFMKLGVPYEAIVKNLEIKETIGPIMPHRPTIYNYML